MDKVDYIAGAFGVLSFIAIYLFSVIFVGPFVGGMVGFVLGFIVFLMVVIFVMVIGRKIEDRND